MEIISRTYFENIDMDFVDVYRMKFNDLVIRYQFIAEHDLYDCWHTMYHRHGFMMNSAFIPAQQEVWRITTITDDTSIYTYILANSKSKPLDTISGFALSTFSALLNYCEK